MGDAFFCITLSVIVLRIWWKNNYSAPKPKKLPPTPITIKNEPVDTALKEKQEAEKQRQQDIADLKRQGYSDEVITTILPVIEG